MTVKYNSKLNKQEVDVIFDFFVHPASNIYWELIWKVSSFF